MSHPARPPLPRSVIRLAALALVACDTSTELVPPPLAVVANPQSLTCIPGLTTAIGLTITGGRVTPVVTFSVVGGDAVIRQNGPAATVTCGLTSAAGQIVYTVTSGGETVTGTIPITRTLPGPLLDGTTLVVAPTSVTLGPGATQQLNATVTLPSGAPTGASTAVTWSSADTTIATVSGAAC